MATDTYEKKNVILIIGDSLRSDHMQVYGYERPTTPYLNSLFEKGKLRKVKMALATCPESACGILSTLGSINYKSISNYNFKIHDLLWDLGYNVYFLLSGDQTHYENLRWYFGQSIDLYYDGNDADGFSMNDDRLILEGLRKVPNYKDTPSFFYFHLMSPHFLGDKLEAYNRYIPSEINQEYSTFVRGVKDRTAYVNRYDNGIIQTDAMIEEIFKELGEKGYLRNSIVVILGDHGEGLGERGNFGHDKNLYQEDINIPFLIYDDPEINYRNLEFATQLDVAPTIINRLGLPVPHTWEGESLLNEDKKCFSYHQTRSKTNGTQAIFYRVDGKIYKYMSWAAKDEGKSREELYELISDPGEKRNLISVANFDLEKLIGEKMTESLSCNNLGRGNI
jgi:glucan phosphoethanolaminetransferase (alkaline phosphatase superfamily)